MGRRPPVYSSTCEPTSITRPAGKRKKSELEPAFQCIAANSLRATAPWGRCPRDDGIAADEVGRLLGSTWRPWAAASARPSGTSGASGTRAQREAPEADREVIDHDAVGRRDVRHVDRLHPDEDVALVQHLVVLEVVQQRVRHACSVGGEEHRRARHAQRRASRRWPRQERRRARASPCSISRTQLAARAARSSSARTRPAPSASGNQPPSRIFSAFAPKNARSIEHERHGQRRRRGQRVQCHMRAPRAGRASSIDHRAGDRDAVGRRRAPWSAEAEHAAITHDQSASS